jgi:SagB-type dehydrogenase family enzyme
MSETQIDSFDPGRQPLHWDAPQFKEYPRFPELKLPSLPEPLGADLFSCITARRTPISLKQSNTTLGCLSTLLAFSSAESRNGSRFRHYRVYPSAGAKYPLEIYPIILRGRDISPGIYHYAVKRHTLHVLLEQEVGETLRSATAGDARLKKAACVFVITGVLSRTIEKYGERGLRYVLLEAGHLAQNLILCATAMKLACAPIGGFIDREVAELLDVDKEVELPLYLVVLGRP